MATTLERFRRISAGHRVAEVKTLQRRLVAGDEALVMLLETDEPRLPVWLMEWGKLETDYRLAVEELRERGVEEPDL